MTIKGLKLKQTSERKLNTIEFKSRKIYHISTPASRELKQCLVKPRKVAVIDFPVENPIDVETRRQAYEDGTEYVYV